ncbi:MAG: response regulator transcription factor [Planctomycetes bacterium]|nr:response regulator transcription factor [Planctomycetota bacterium]
MDQDGTNTSNFVVRVVDDDADARNFFCRSLERESIETRAYASADEFLSRDDLRSPGCLILDVKMPGCSGIQLQEQLVETGCPLPMIFVSGHGNVQMVAHSMRLGAIDFLEKPIEPSILIARVHEAFAIDREWRNEHADRDRAKKRLARLTPRESEVLQYLVRGLPAKRVAAELDLSHKTVQVHRANIMAKTGIDNLADLVRLVLLASGQAEDAAAVDGEQPAERG